MKINVAVIEKTKEIRAKLSDFIGSQEGLSCYGTYELIEDAIEDFSNSCPDIVLMPVNKASIKHLKKFRKECKNSIFMVLTSFEESGLLLEAMNAGATAYYYKAGNLNKLQETILEAHKVKTTTGSEKNTRIRLKKSVQSANDLSERELEILDFLAHGYRYKEIAEKLFLSIETVRTHIKNIYAKLHVNSRTNALLKYKALQNS
jgi:two-component system, NarL family, response regulator LiaR